MDPKELLHSTEVWTGLGLILVGLVVRGFGAGDLFALALPPFGLGLILSDVAARLAKAARDRAKVRVKEYRGEEYRGEEYRGEDRDES